MLVKVNFALILLYAISTQVSIAGMELLGALLLISTCLLIFQSKNRKELLSTGLNWEVFYLFFVCTVGFLIGEWTDKRFEMYSQCRWIFLFFAFYVAFQVIELINGFKKILGLMI